MNPSLSSSFLSFDLEPNELKAAYTYSALQAVGIKNLIAAAAEEVMKIQLGSDDLTTEMLKRRSYLQGQVHILQYLLQLHDDVNAPTQETN